MSTLSPDLIRVINEKFADLIAAAQPMAFAGSASAMRSTLFPRRVLNRKSAFESAEHDATETLPVFETSE